MALGLRFGFGLGLGLGLGSGLGLGLGCFSLPTLAHFAFAFSSNLPWLPKVVRCHRLRLSHSASCRLRRCAVVCQ